MLIPETIAVAFAMFSSIPVPQPIWNEKNMRYALCAFPLVGCVIGLVWWIICYVSIRFALPRILSGALLCLASVVITGGIHLDGYADTCDALASYGDRAKRQQILNDPHCGAFAVIRLCSYFVAWFSLCVVFDGADYLLMGLGFVLSRTFSGLAIASFPIAKDTGLAHSFATAADKKKVRIILSILALITELVLILLGGFAGLAMDIAALAVLVWYYRVAMKSFGGTSGDLAGWFLQKAEIWMLAALVTCQLMEII